MLLDSKTFLFTSNDELSVQTIMEVYKPRFAIVALLLSAFAIMETTQQTSAEFDAARQKIYHEHINYKKFCSEKPQGEEKIACRIKDIPSVGFLVCKSPIDCDEDINTEVNNIRTLKKSKVKTVNVPDKYAIIHDVQCANDRSSKCSGFLEGWIDKKEGQFQHIRDHISDGTVPRMIVEVKKITKRPQLLKKHAEDLRNIKKFMKPGPGQPKYHICDLQGFFLVKGGFLVGDAPQIAETSKTKNCYDSDPSTEKILSGLDTMIRAFQ